MSGGLGHWIGIRKGWEALSGDPLGYLQSLPPSDLRTHLLVIGSTGYGKTVLLQHLIAQDILLGHSFRNHRREGRLV